MLIRIYTISTKSNFRRKCGFTMVDDGLMVGEKTTPIVDVCLYVPLTVKGSFPSVLCMLGIPAVVAKVPKIVVVTPPNEKVKLTTLFWLRQR